MSFPLHSVPLKDVSVGMLTPMKELLRGQLPLEAVTGVEVRPRQGAKRRACAPPSTESPAKVFQRMKAQRQGRLLASRGVDSILTPQAQRSVKVALGRQEQPAAVGKAPFGGSLYTRIPENQTTKAVAVDPLILESPQKFFLRVKQKLQQQQQQRKGADAAPSNPAKQNIPPSRPTENPLIIPSVAEPLRNEPAECVATPEGDEDNFLVESMDADDEMSQHSYVNLGPTPSKKGDQLEERWQNGEAKHAEVDQDRRELKQRRKLPGVERKSETNSQKPSQCLRSAMLPSPRVHVPRKPKLKEGCTVPLEEPHTDQVASKADKEEAICLTNWRIKVIDGNTAICVQGKRRDKDDACWQSSAIIERITRNRVRTVSGSIYWLKGNMDSATMRREGKKAMAAIVFLVRVFLSLIPNLPMVGDELDEDTRERMAQYALRMEKEMSRLLQELYKAQEGSSLAWITLLVNNLQHWQFWVIAGALVLFACLCCWMIRLLQETKERTLHKKAQEQSRFSWRALLFNLKQWYVCVTTGLLFLLVLWFKKKTGNKQQLKQQKQKQKQKHKKKENELDRICQPVQERIKMMEEARLLVILLTNRINVHLFHSSFPELESPIGVDRGFEGWGSNEGVPVYRFIVPLTAPLEHIFHPVPDTAGRKPASIFRIRMKLKCTCPTVNLAEEIKRSFQHFMQDRRENQTLQTLCTSSYLDVEKTAAWLDENVKAVWEDVPGASKYCLEIMPSTRTRIYHLGRGSETILRLEIIFGVQLMNSDIFVTSEPSEKSPTPSTKWTVSFAVAELKFFMSLTRQAPRKRVYFKCLRTCAHLVQNTSLSIYTFKTAVMHLLHLVGPFDWDDDDFVPRMVEIMQYVRHCLKEKRLNHFFYGYEIESQDIILPLQWQVSPRLNLFEHLERDSEAHARAVRDLIDVRFHCTWLILGY